MIHQNVPLSGKPVPQLPAPGANSKKKGQGDGLERQILTGYLLIAIMAAAVFGWAAKAEISGAVVGGGRVIVEANEKLVQHPTGGVVGKINVIEGAHVQEGEVVMRLDDTAVRSNLDIVLAELSTMKARLARLQAERDGEQEIRFPTEMKAFARPADEEAMKSETRFFQSRTSARLNQKEQLRRKVDQLREQVKGYDEVIASRKKQLDLLQAQVKISADLRAKNLATGSALTDLQQGIARTEGDYGSNLQQRATVLAQISETELQITGVDQAMQADVMKDIRDTESKIEEYEARRIAAQDQLSRADIRATASGVVHELNVHTVGGVVMPNDVIMKIVPAGAKLQFEVRVNPNDIDQVQMGQEARLRFPAFNRAHTPEVTGRVTMVAADASTEKQTGRSYYEVLIEPGPDMVAKLKEKGVELVPGMPVEAFLQTGDRSVLSYMLKPLTDQVERAFREE